LETVGLVGFCKTTGGKGLHVVTPLASRRGRPLGWPEAKSFAQDICREMSTDDPTRYVLNTPLSIPCIDNRLEHKRALTLPAVTGTLPVSVKINYSCTHYVGGCQMAQRIFVGTAGWTIPRGEADNFPKDGSSLVRYASKFDAVEINSTFRKYHRQSTLVRWASSVNDYFRFALKMPKKISHELKLRDAEEDVLQFIEATRALGKKIGPLLLQLPPSLAFGPDFAETFFKMLRRCYSNPVVCEPRHISWFEANADRLLKAYEIGRVAADPARTPAAGQPGGYAKIEYYRLHGSPDVYYSSYPSAALSHLAERIRRSNAEETWCMFDNTASGAATADALAMQLHLKSD